jgi:hypothetical protein
MAGRVLVARKVARHGRIVVGAGGAVRFGWAVLCHAAGVAPQTHRMDTVDRSVEL